ncbi:4'-phosphopantetheinyl transferase family protein [Nesterenkonia alkaliphila]
MRPVGVDVERTVGRTTMRNLTPLLHPCEQREFRRVDRPLECAAFTQLWVRKEAYLKGLGTGLARELHLDYVGAEGLAAHPVGWVFADIEVPTGYSAAVAIAAETGQEVVVELQ